MTHDTSTPADRQAFHCWLVEKNSWLLWSKSYYNMATKSSRPAVIMVIFAPCCKRCNDYELQPLLTHFMYSSTGTHLPVISLLSNNSVLIQEEESGCPLVSMVRGRIRTICGICCQIILTSLEVSWEMSFKNFFSDHCATTLHSQTILYYTATLLPEARQQLVPRPTRPTGIRIYMYQ